MKKLQLNKDGGRTWEKETTEERIRKKTNRLLSKRRNTLEYGVSRVKEAADTTFWSTNHEGCFKCTFGPGETKLHRNKKYERWQYHKTLKRKVFCELRLKTGDRPDLTIVDKGFVFIEEIVVSEKEESMKRKKANYPFPTQFIRADAYKNSIFTDECEKELKKNGITYKLTMGGTQIEFNKAHFTTLEWKHKIG